MKGCVKEYWPFNSLCHFIEEGLENIGENKTMTTCLFVFLCLWLEAAISDHWADPQYLKDRAFFAYLSSQKLFENGSTESCTAVCHGAEGERWVYATVIWAEIDQN